MIKNKEDWRDYLPHGKKAELAEKYGLSRTAVTKIIRREDVINYPELIEEARNTALRAMDLCRRHAAAVSGNNVHQDVIA